MYLCQVCKKQEGLTWEKIIDLKQVDAESACIMTQEAEKHDPHA